ncbi:MAG TPA: glycosyl hydrolase family 65 protein [Streptosporangiaceae bacterium]|nr:glycosyl hydrolase family 65 protein [Streptosporangiaceae bacterium]
MILHPAFPVEPWCLRESTLHVNMLAETESVFALSNGHIGWRANLDEGEPHGLPGSYLNGVYEQRPLPYAEAGFGYPESGQTMINVTNGKLIRLLVDDEPFDIRYGELLRHERVLDFRAGTLSRRAEWVSPAGRHVRVSSVRLVSLTQRSVAAVSYQVEALDGPVRVVVQSELVANEELPPSGRDPRIAAALAAPLVAVEHGGLDGRALLMHRTKHSDLTLATCMQHHLACDATLHERHETRPDLARLTVGARLDEGQPLRLVKFVAYGWSGIRSRPALRDQVEGALLVAEQTGWDGLGAEQRGYLDDFWSRADVELEGDEEIQQAVRFGMFHVLQAGARAEDRPIPAKGLSGNGYDGHSFWDSEAYVLPVLTYTVPEAAAHALRWRHSTLPRAAERARQLGLRGAAFPWRTIDGEECSGYWPAGTAAFHVNADIADAVVRYVDATGDQEFDRLTGFDLLVQTARLWCSLGHHDGPGTFRIDGVTGPDEYSAIADNNVYTNLMAQQNLRAAADVVQRYPDRARELRVSADEVAQWQAAADGIVLPYDEKLGVHCQAEGFTEHQVWDFAGTSAHEYPLLAHFPYFELYRKQVVKQADLVLAMQLCPDAFSAEQKARNFAYYEGLTVRDSSLSASSQAVIAAETGHLELAYDYLGETALMDMADLEHNTRDGLHVAALAGTWIVLVKGFGGMRHRRGQLPSFAPRLPPALTRLTFTLTLRGRPLRVEVTPVTASYLLDGDGPPIEIWHHGKAVTVSAGQPQTLDIPGLPPQPRPAQPHGREPAQRGRPAGRPRRRSQS